MAAYIDLKNLVDLQKSFVNAASAPTATSEQIAATNTLDNNLTTLSTNLDTAASSIGPTLTYQTEVKTILDREKGRLDAKKSTIDAAYMGQQRMVDLTNSQTKKNKAYNLILIVAVITFLVVLGIKQVYDNGIIPNTVLDIMNIVILSVGMIYCVVLYMDVYNRSNMDFDQITLDQPYRKSQAEIDADRAKQLASGQLSDATAGANAGCVGAQCCPVDSSFNEYNKICVPNYAPQNTPSGAKAFYDPSTRIITWINPATPSGCGGANRYDPLTLACKVTAQGFETMNTSAGAQPYTPCEFSQYNAYNRCGTSAM
jgi:hypothetical protein